MALGGVGPLLECVNFDRFCAVPGRNPSRLQGGGEEMASCRFFASYGEAISDRVAEGVGLLADSLSCGFTFPVVHGPGCVGRT
jgi:hypothetical protein